MNQKLASWMVLVSSFGLFFLALWNGLSLAADKPPDPSWTTKGVVTRVIDGDTVEVETRRVMRVRFLDCWAPESKIDPRVAAEITDLEKRKSIQDQEKQKGLKSKAHLEELAAGKVVTVRIPMDAGGDIAKSITMGRVLGHVWVDGDSQSLSERQVGGGYATVAKPEELK